MTTLKRNGLFLAALAVVAALAAGPLYRPAVADSPSQAAGLVQLTSGGCCTRPFWSQDSQQVLYIDKPDPSAPVGIYGVPVAAPQQPRLVTPRIAAYSHGLSLIIDVQPGLTTIERVADGTQWTVPAAGRTVTVSPNQKRVAWALGSGGGGSSSSGGVSRIQVANLDGSDQRTAGSINRGSIGGWISDDVLLLSSRVPRSRVQVLSTLSILTGEVKELFRAENLRGQTLSPDGAWVAFHVAPNPDAKQNGLWLVRTDGSAAFRANPELFGPVQWRDSHRLLVVPFRAAAEHHELWELDMATQQARRLTDPRVTQMKINDGDWTASPDGRSVAFVSASDRNLWLLVLPD